MTIAPIPADTNVVPPNGVTSRAPVTTATNEP
jgi:hypothetical protein